VVYWYTSVLLTHSIDCVAVSAHKRDAKNSSTDERSGCSISHCLAEELLECFFLCHLVILCRPFLLHRRARTDQRYISSGSRLVFGRLDHGHNDGLRCG